MCIRDSIERGNLQVGTCDFNHSSEFGETEDYTLNITDNLYSFENVLMFPNPANPNNQINFLFEIPDINELIIFKFHDYSGRLILTEAYESDFSTFNQSIPLNSLSGGVYFVTIQNGSNTISKKLIVK